MLSEIQIIRCTPGVYLSDHCTIECLLSLKKSQLQEKEINYRKLGLIDPRSFSQLLELDGYDELQLDGMVEVLDNNFRRAIDKLAPLKIRNIMVRPTNPWFDNEIRNQKIVTPFPDSESDVILANQFADYFTEKIRVFRSRLEEHPMYKPQETAKAFMSKFERVTESEVAK